MRAICRLFLILAVGGLLQTAHGELNLVVRSDLECRLTVDGKPGGVLQPGNEIQIPVDPGEHRVEAVPLSGGAHWEQAVSVDASAGAVLAIPLRAAVERAEVKSRGYWLDPATHFMWTPSDNGVGVSQFQAAYFCRTLAAAGFSDWAFRRLMIYSASSAAHRTRARAQGPIRLTGWAWSASPGQEPGQFWALDFGDGARASVVAGDSGLNRALCVRRVGK